MVWSERRLKDHFAAELIGPKLSVDQLQSVRDAVYEAVTREGVVVVRNQDLSDDELEAFAASVGLVMSYPGLGAHIPNVVPLGNIGPDGKLLPEDGDFMRASLANMLWHIDSALTFTWWQDLCSNTFRAM